MAVSMNTGGYMRSDFMISDAAIPMRLEELEAEQSEKFAQLLGSFGTNEGTQDIPDEETAVLLENEPVDLNEELIAQEGEAISDLMGAVLPLKADSPEKAMDGEDTPADSAKRPEKKPAEATDSTGKAVAAMAANTAVVIDNAAAELSELAAFAAEIRQPEAAVPETEIVPETAAVPETKAVTEAEAVPVVSQQPVIAQAAEPAVTARQPESKPETAVKSGGNSQKTDVFVRTETEEQQTVAAAQPQEQPQQQSSYRQGRNEPRVEVLPQGNEYSREETAAQPQEFTRSAVTAEETAVTTDAEKLQVLAKAAENGEISRPEVRKSAETPVQRDSAELTPRESVTAAPQPVRNRVKQASEELEMLRSAKVSERADKSQAERPQQVVDPANQTEQPLQAAVTVRTESGSVEVKREEIVRQAAELVRTAVTESAENPEKTEYTLTLDPEELGKITVKLSKAADGAVSVTVAAEKSATQRILEQNSALLQDSLKNSGVKLESWQTVSQADREHYAQDYNGSSKNPYYRREPQQQPDEEDGGSFAELIAAM
ncbi:MAG: flagellar hook-length control protein FliK [Oscillospiraceae bacterium]